MGIHGVVFAVLLLFTLGAAAEEKLLTPEQVEAARIAAENELNARRFAEAQALVRELTALYEATPGSCGFDVWALDCSGVIIRGTRQNLPQGTNAWDPYPPGRTLDISFSLIRADIKVTRLANWYSNGFIISLPTSQRVDCFYPSDADSDQRLAGGCGPNPAALASYTVCEVLMASHPVEDRTSEEYRWTLKRVAGLWIDRDKRLPDDASRNMKRCAYNLQDRHATQRLEIALTVATQISLVNDKPNDLKIQTWSAGNDSRLAVQAFFYINEQGKAYALRDRERFEQVSGNHVPVIRLTFPAQREGMIAFAPGE